MVVFGNTEKFTVNFGMQVVLVKLCKNKYIQCVTSVLQVPDGAGPKG